jgi:shikimate dehydrogenase
MRCFGLIGFPLSHSFSKKYFTEKFEREGISDCRYDNYPIEHITFLNSLVAENSDLVGLNVTIPFKEKVLSFLDEIDPEASIIGAVNTIRIFRNEKGTSLKGYNTDVYGFRESIRPYIKQYLRKAYILGTGGSSKAVSFVLKNLGMEVIFVSRNPKQENHISYGDLIPGLLSHPSVIVNASPAGMFPHTNNCPDIRYEYLTPDHVLFDLVYNPPETLFLSKGKERGAKTINGLQMLHLQANRSWEIWNGNISG